jgi:hypothetical protein
MPRWAPWAEAGVEPSITDVLSDPIVHTLMRADGVLIADLLAIIFSGDDRVTAERDRACSNETGFDWTHGISAGS